jgi:hypothetical protein
VFYIFKDQAADDRMGGVALIGKEIVVPRYGFGGSVVFIEVVYQLIIARI